MRFFLLSFSVRGIFAPFSADSKATSVSSLNSFAVYLERCCTETFNGRIAQCLVLGH